jgi:hypothetical protein
MRSLSAALAWTLLLAALTSAAASAEEADSTAAMLRPTSDTPWTPATVVRGEEPWETAVRFPGKIVSLPLWLLGRATEAGLLYAEDQNVVYRLLALLAFQRQLGLAVTPASLGDGTGFGGAVHWAPPFVSPHVAAELSGSTRMYNRERVALNVGPFGARYTSEWRSQDPFFGLGMESVHDDEATYATRSQSAEVSVTWPPRAARADVMPLVGGEAIRPGAAGRPSPITQIALSAGPREVFLTDGRSADEPSFEEKFPALAPLLHRRVEHLVYGARLSHDARSGRPRWSRGWRASAEAERFDRSIEAIALKDAHSDALSFTRLTWRAEGAVSFWTDPRTLRLALTVIDQQPDDAGGAFLIPDLSRLGGSSGLAGFEAGRFQDMDLVLGKLSYLFPLGKNLEFDWHVEAGGVFPEIGAARIDRLETSYGGILRVRTDAAMAGAVGFEWSREGARLKFSIGDIE